MKNEFFTILLVEVLDGKGSSHSKQNLRSSWPAHRFERILLHSNLWSGPT